MAARVASGPGFWTDWLAELDRQGLLEDLLAEDVIARALREAPPGHKYDRVLTAKMTVICVLVACLFPGAGYDTVLATAFGLPGLRPRPGTEVPSGAAFSQARKLLGEQVMKRIFELDAAVADADLGIGLLWKGLEVTAIDGTTMELARNGVLEGEFGTPGGAAPARCCGSPPTSAPRPSAGSAPRSAATTTARTPWQTSWKTASGPACSTSPTAASSPCTAGSGSPAPARTWPGGSRTARNPSRSRPSETLPDGSELVMLHESDGMRTRRGRNQATRARNGSRTPSPGWSPSPSPPRPAAAGRRPPGCGC